MCSRNEFSVWRQPIPTILRAKCAIRRIKVIYVWIPFISFLGRRRRRRRHRHQMCGFFLLPFFVVEEGGVAKPTLNWRVVFDTKAIIISCKRVRNVKILNFILQYIQNCSTYYYYSVRCTIWFELNFWWIDEIRRKRMSRLMTCRTYHSHNGFFCFLHLFVRSSILVFAKKKKNIQFSSARSAMYITLPPYVLALLLLTGSFFSIHLQSFCIYAQLQCNRNWNFRA